MKGTVAQKTYILAQCIVGFTSCQATVEMCYSADVYVLLSEQILVDNLFCICLGQKLHGVMSV